MNYQGNLINLRTQVKSKTQFIRVVGHSEGASKFTIFDLNNFKMVDHLPMNKEIHKPNS